MNLRKTLDKIFIVFFLTLIFIPNLGLFEKPNAKKIIENLHRLPYEFPQFKLTNPENIDFSGIENWYTDRVLFITELSKIYSSINYDFGISSKPEMVIIGKQGWLFLGNYYTATLDQYLGNNLPTEEEILLQIRTFKQMNEIAKQHNIPFLVVVAPDKHDIYSEYLPRTFSKGFSKSRLDILDKKLPENGINFIDLRKAEFAAKNTLGHKYGDIYFKGDSHWNFLGAYAAYQQIAKNLNHYGIQIDKQPISFIPQVKTKNGLALFLQLNNVKSNNPQPDIRNLQMDIFRRDIYGHEQKLSPFDRDPNKIFVKNPYEIINKQRPYGKTCLLIGDSFSNNLGFYFYNDFHDTVRIYNHNTDYSLSLLIHKYHPDVIIFEIVERDLLNYANSFTPFPDNVNLQIPHNPLPVDAFLDTVNIDQDKLTVEGWGYLPTLNAENSRIYFKLSNTKNSYIFPVQTFLRPDLSVFNNGFHLSMAGFKATILKKNIDPGVYRAAIIIANGNKVGLKQFESRYTIK